MFNNVDLNKALLNQKGAGHALVRTGDHIFDWKAKNRKTKELSHIDINKAIHNQYGADHFAVYSGLHAYNWKATSLTKMKNKIVPTLIIPMDKRFEIEPVKKAITNFSSLMNTIKKWLEENAKLTFEYTDPVICLDDRDYQYWIDLSNLAGHDDTGEDLEKRFKYYWNAARRIELNFRKTNDVAFFGCVYIGTRTGITEGAADGYKVENPPILPPSTVSFNYDQPINSMWSTHQQMLSGAIHELLHNFGLVHPSADSVEAEYSIMHNAQVPRARLFPKEIEILQKSNFLTKI